MSVERVLGILSFLYFWGIEATPIQSDTVCRQKPADIVFLLDSSGSVGLTNFKKQLDFVSIFANSFTIGQNAVQIGVVTFSTTSRNEFWLNQYLNNADLVKAIQDISYRGGGTHTDIGLNFVKSEAFTALHGDRNYAPNILIVMTDGRSQTHSLTAAAANNIKMTTAWSVFAIGVGASVSVAELNIIATDPMHVFTVSNFDALINIRTSLITEACANNLNPAVTAPAITEPVTGVHASASTACQDAIPNCSSFSSSCSAKGPLETWAQIYCQRYCNLCNQAGSGTLIG